MLDNSIPYKINSTSGAKGLGVKPRTGVCYGLVTNGFGLDCAYVFVNNSATAQKVQYNLYDTTGTAVGAVKSTGMIPGFGGQASGTASVDFLGKTGILIAWLSSTPDDGTEEDLKLYITGSNGIGGTSLWTSEGRYPPDLRNQSTNHPCRMGLNTVNVVGYDDVAIYINPNYPLSINAAGYNTFTGTLNANFTPSTGITGTFYDVTGPTSGNIVPNAGLLDNCLFYFDIASSSTAPLGRSSAGTTVNFIINSENEFDVYNGYFIAGSVLAFSWMDRFYT